MIKILHIIQGLSSGGAARAAVATAKYSAQLGGFQHRVASLRPAEPAGLELAREAGLPVIDAPDRHTLMREIEQADIVHVNWWNNPELQDLLHSELPATRLLIWFHVAGDSPPQIITQELVDFADFALACSPYTYERPVFRNLPPEIRTEKTGMVYGAADFARISGVQPKPHSTFNVGYIGTIDFIKMHPNYVPMSAAIEIPDVRFIVCGEGIEDLLRTQAQKLGVAERFDFRGYVEDISSVIEILDVYGYPLCEETYAAAELTLQEVMYAGVPSVAFPNGGVRHLVVDDYTGLIVHSELEYKQAIEYLYHHPEERQRLGRNAREYARQTFGAENAARKLNSIYERMMQLPKRERVWGGVAGASILDQPVSLQDLTGQPERLSGSQMFIDSLGDAAQDFIVSKNSQDVEVLFDVEERIASSSPLLRSAGAGGILHYRNYDPNDEYLRLWAGLVLQRLGKYPEAVSELATAIDLGCDHWRVFWYLARAAEQAGDTALAKKAVDAVSQAAPNFSATQEMSQRLSREQGTTKNARAASGLKQPDKHTVPHRTSQPLKQSGAGRPTDVLVSAIVSTYNSERFIHGCLEDLEAQTIADRLEIIVVDSGSQQNERAIVEAFQQRYDNIVYIRTEERESIYAAWNRAIQVARGQYITNANTDDRHRADALEIMARTLDERPDVGLVYADSLITSVPNETFASNTADRGLRWPDFSLRQLLMFSMFGPQPMWRRRLHTHIGAFDPGYVVAGDYEFFIRLAWRHGAYHIPEVLGLYYEGPGIEHRNQAQSHEETHRILQHYRSTIPIEDIYPALHETLDQATAAGIAMVDFANYLMSSLHPDYQVAEQYYRQALELLGEEPAILNNLALALYLAGQTKQSLTLLDSLAPRGYRIAQQNRDQIQRAAGKIPNLTIATLHHPVLDELPPLVSAEATRIPRTAQKSRGDKEPGRQGAGEARDGADQLPLTPAPMHRSPGYSFCIITDGKRPQKLERLIESIHAQGISDYEIIVAGIAEPRDDITYLPMPEAARAGRTSVLRNAAAARSRYDHLVFADDDIVLQPGWFSGLQPYAGDYDLLATKLLNLDGTRHWDWATHGGPNGHGMLNYNERDEHLYLTSGLCVVKARAWETIQWNERLGFQESEDVDFSKRALNAGFQVHFCEESVAVHNDERYTQVGRSILKRSEEGVAAWLNGELSELTPSELMDRALAEFERRRVAEAADCLRYCLTTEPAYEPANQIWNQLVQAFGGPVDSGAWHPHPILESGSPDDHRASHDQTPSAAISTQTPREVAIKWGGSIFDFSGYARLSRDTLLTLDRPGVTLAIESFALDDQFKAQLTPGETQTWQRLLEHQVEDGSCICFHPPTLWDGTDVFATYRQQNPGFEAYIGISMFETDRLPAGWAEACNGMDEIWVPSTFNRETFVRAGVDPDRLQVIPFGLDTQAYDPARVSPMDIPERRGFTFLSVFQWTKRKGWDVMLKAYLSAFTPADDVCLVLRTHPGWTKTPPIQERINRYIRQLGYNPEHTPPIILLEDFVPEKDMPALYAAADAFVLPTRGEGWGIPFMEAMAMELPVIATRWSAHLDFMNDDNSYLVDVEDLVPVDPDQTAEDSFYEPDHRWAEPSVTHTAALMRRVYEHRDEARAKGTQARQDIQNHWHPERTAGWILERVTHRTPSLLWHAPVFDPSGYADDARSLALGLDRLGATVRLHPITETSPRFVDAMEPALKAELDRLTQTPIAEDYVNLIHFPAYAFQRDPQARYNIGRTMFETDRIPDDWVAKCNQMDEIWVPTEFNRRTFASAGVTVPLIRIPMGVDTTRFHPNTPAHEIAQIEGFKFLSVFEWSFRKGWDVLLRAWAEAFQPDEEVGLILRTNPMQGADDPAAAQQINDWIAQFYMDRMGRTPQEVAPIYILPESLYRGLPGLYAAADAFVLPSRGEGWGRPYIEAMATGLPVIGTRWSGNLEFMNDNNSFLIDIEGLVEVTSEMEIPFYQGHKWAEPSVDHLVELMREVYKHPEAAQARGRRARQDTVEKWNWDNAVRLILERLEALLTTDDRRPMTNDERRTTDDQRPTTAESTAGRRPPTAASEWKMERGKWQMEDGQWTMEDGQRKEEAGTGESNLRSPTSNFQSPISNLQSPTIRWEGSQFVHHSLALVNRELCLQLIEADHELSIIPYEPDQFGPEVDARFHKLAERVHAPLSRPADVHVRHQWPPNFNPPREGHWVIIQPWEFGSLPKRWVEVMSTQVDEIWVPSTYVRDCYIRSGVLADRVHVVPNGVDTNLFNPEAAPLNPSKLHATRNTQPCPRAKRRNATRNTHFKFLFVGGTIYRKGIDVLLNAYVNTFSADDDVCLVIKDMGGRSFYRGQTLEQGIRRLQALPDAPAILYLDQNLDPDQLPGLYTACDCLVHPYRGEGFGLPIAEAMACGLPVIATDYGAALDFCDTDTAYLVPAVEKRLPEQRISNMETVDYPWLAEPDVEALSQWMRHVYENPDEARSQGERASTRIRTEFTWEHAAEKAMTRLQAIQEQPIRRQQGERTMENGKWKMDDGKRKTENGKRKTENGRWKMEGEAGKKEVEVRSISNLQPPTFNLQSPISTLLAQADAAIAQENLAEARAILRQAIEAHPDSVEAQTIIASVAMAQGDHQAAQDQLVNAIELAPEDPELYNQLGSAYYGAGDHQLAEQAFQQALAMDPANLNARMSLAEMARAQGHYDEAARHYIQALEEHPDDVELLITFGRLAAEIDEPETAQAALQRAVDLDTSREDAQRMLETLKQQPTANGQPPTANQEAEERKSEGAPEHEADQPSSYPANQPTDPPTIQSPNHPAIQLMEEANEALVQDDLSRAAQVLETCIDRYPTYSDAYIALASVASAGGDHTRSQSLLLTAMTLEPDRAELFNQLGCAYFADGKIELAENAFQQALKLAPGDADAIVNLAEVHRSRQRYEQAARLLIEALATHPDDVNVLAAFGYLSLEINEPEAAWTAFEKASQLDPSREDVRKALEKLKAQG